MGPGPLLFEPARQLLADVPVDPDRDTARRMLVEELGKPVYRESKGLVQRVLEWIQERLSDLAGLGDGISGTWVAIILMVCILAVGAIALVVAGPVRRRRAAGTPGAVLEDDARTAAQMRASAAVEAAAGNLALATIERFRAIVRSLEERALLDDAPSRTAEEAAAGAAVYFPEHAIGISDAARLFDAVLYGHRPVGEDAYRRIATLDDVLVAMRPVRAHGAPSTSLEAGQPDAGLTLPTETTGVRS